jgi:hypothetical protein
MAMLLLDRPFEDAQLSSGTDLDLRNVGPKVWPRVLSECRSADLRLYHVTTTSLEGIEQLAGVKRLTLEWAPKVADLTPLFRMHGLACLSVFDVPKVRDLEGIEQLTELVELNLSGSRGALTPKMRITSLEPITRMPSLTRFSLANTRLDDDDITVLARCPKLQYLHLSNQFERTQVAFLAKAMNRRLVEAISAGFETTLACEKCHGRKYMFSGRRMPILCRSCDKARFEKYSSEFKRLVRDA